MYSLDKFTRILVSGYLVVLVLFNFFKAVDLKSNSNIVPSNSGNIDICKMCCSEKSKRMHHCTVCNKCIRKMDHHCPWIDNW